MAERGSFNRSLKNPNVQQISPDNEPSSLFDGLVVADPAYVLAVEHYSNVQTACELVGYSLLQVNHYLDRIGYLSSQGFFDAFRSQLDAGVPKLDTVIVLETPSLSTSANAKTRQFDSFMSRTVAQYKDIVIAANELGSGGIRESLDYLTEYASGLGSIGLHGSMRRVLMQPDKE